LGIGCVLGHEMPRCAASFEPCSGESDYQLAGQGLRVGLDGVVMQLAGQGLRVGLDGVVMFHLLNQIP